MAAATMRTLIAGPGRANRCASALRSASEALPSPLRRISRRGRCTSGEKIRRNFAVRGFGSVPESTADTTHAAGSLNEYVNSKSSSGDDAALLAELRAVTFQTWPKAEQLIDEPQGKLLTFLVQLTRASKVLEIGCFTGYSALCLANGLTPAGSVLTCDVNEETMAFANSYFRRSTRSAQIQSVCRDGMELLDDLAGRSEQFDVIFVDANKRQYAAYYETILAKRLLRPDGLLIFDNTLFRGRVLAAANGLASKKERLAHGLAAFNAHVAADPRTCQTLLPLWDGVTLVRQAS